MLLHPGSTRGLPEHPAEAEGSLFLYTARSGRATAHAHGGDTKEATGTVATAVAEGTAALEAEL